MAIKKTTKEPPHSEREFRDMLHPFIQDESGIGALKGLIDGHNNINRGGMYLLEILNNIISSKNGTEKVFQRIPQEVFGGLSEGGRRNVQASLIARAVQGADTPEQGRILASGYTRIQEVIGHWAERDGSWSDTPEGDLIRQGFQHDPLDDGSEARIFDRGNGAKIYKTIDFSHYNQFELMLDRISIHNAVFPEMALKVEGFGMRDDSENSDGYVVIISQPKAIGTVPTQEDIEKGMKERFFDKSENGFFWINGLDNIVVADIHDQNAVVSPNGKLLVFDCEAFLKMFPVDSMKPEVHMLRDLLPKGNGIYNEEPWRKILGDQYPNASDNDKAELLRELRLTGKVNGLVNGKVIAMRTPVQRLRQLSDGRTILYYDSPQLLVGEPKTFHNEHMWKAPPVETSHEREEQILDTVRNLTPLVLDVNSFFNAARWAGPDIAGATRAAASTREEMLNQLKSHGHIEGLVNGRYHVQLNPNDPSTVLVSDYRKVEFMLWTNNTDIDGLGQLTQNEKKMLSIGNTVTKGGVDIRFNLEKGRIDRNEIMQRKLNLKIEVEVAAAKKKEIKKNVIRL